jgi:ssDNA-binding Zn-finger/Zn-ribbon topoisomerase 1
MAHSANRKSSETEIENTRVASSDSRVGDIVEKKGRGRGKPFYACTRYPECTFLMNKKLESQADVDAGFEAWKNKPATPAKKTRAKKKEVG